MFISGLINNDNNKEEGYNENKIKFLLNNKFQLNDKGPYFIFLENKSGKKLNMHPMTLGKHILTNSGYNYKKSITNIKIVGSNRYKVEFDTPEAANNFVDTQIMKNMDCIAYIPSFLTQKTGVIRGVETSLSDEEIFSNLKASRKLVSFRRMMKKDRNDPKKLFPLETCLVTFASQDLPEFVYIFGTRCRVDPYIPKPSICRKCLRFNHLANQCRSTKPRCSRCGEEHSSSDCQSPVMKCVNCKGEHDATNHSCPKFKELFEKKKDNIIKNTKYSDKTSIVPSIEDSKSFPEMEKNSTHSRITRVKFKRPPKGNNAAAALPTLPKAPSMDPLQPITNNPYRTDDKDYMFKIIQLLNRIKIQESCTFVDIFNALQGPLSIKTESKLNNNNNLNSQNDSSDMEL